MRRKAREFCVVGAAGKCDAQNLLEPLLANEAAADASARARQQRLARSGFSPEQIAKVYGRPGEDPKSKSLAAGNDVPQK